MTHFSSSQFKQALPSEVKELEKYLKGLGYHFVYIGGVVRDFLNLGVMVKDIDVEVTPPKDHVDTWPDKLKNDLQLFKSFEFQIEYLPFSICRVGFSDYEIEMAPARKEVFSNQESYKHSDFNVEYLKEYNPDVSFLRRDFTVNSIGITLKDDESYILVDPFNGLEDLKLKRLKSSNPNFFNDPIRFLRLVRFSIKFDFSIEINHLERFSLEKLSFYHLSKESKKVELVSYILNLSKLIEQYSIACPKWLFEVFDDVLSKERENSLKSFEQVLIEHVFSGNLERAYFYAGLLQVKKKKIDLLIRLTDSQVSLVSDDEIPDLVNKIGLSIEYYPQNSSFVAKYRQLSNCKN